MTESRQDPARLKQPLKLDIPLSQTPRKTLESLCALVDLGYKARVIYLWRGEEQTAKVVRISPSKILTHQGTGSEQTMWDIRTLSGCRARLIMEESDKLFRHRLAITQQDEKGAN